MQTVNSFKKVVLSEILQIEIHTKVRTYHSKKSEKLCNDCRLSSSWWGISRFEVGLLYVESDSEFILTW